LLEPASFSARFSIADRIRLTRNGGGDLELAEVVRARTTHAGG
jgi:hypothetical protein